jgi:hypothetical protein
MLLLGVGESPTRFVSPRELGVENVRRIGIGVSMELTSTATSQRAALSPLKADRATITTVHQGKHVPPDSLRICSHPDGAYVLFVRLATRKKGVR